MKSAKHIKDSDRLQRAVRVIISMTSGGWSSARGFVETRNSRRWRVGCNEIKKELPAICEGINRIVHALQANKLISGSSLRASGYKEFVVVAAVIREVKDAAPGDWLVPAPSVSNALDNVAARIDRITGGFGDRDKVALSVAALRQYAHFAKRYAASLRAAKESP